MFMIEIDVLTMEFLMQFGLGENIDFSTINLHAHGRELNNDISFETCDIKTPEAPVNDSVVHEVKIDQQRKLSVVTNEIANVSHKNLSVEQFSALISSPLVQKFSPIEHKNWSIAQIDFPFSILDNNFDLIVEGVFLFSLSPLSLFVSELMTVRLFNGAADCLFVSTNKNHPLPNASFTIKFCVPLYLFCSNFPKLVEGFDTLAKPSWQKHDAVLFNLVCPAFQIFSRRLNTPTSEFKILKF